MGFAVTGAGADRLPARADGDDVATAWCIDLDVGDGQSQHIAVVSYLAVTGM